MSVYREIGMRQVLNASGSMTYLGGSLIAPEVVEKMNEAARSFVVMDELLEWACSEVARLTGTEAGLVTTGTAGGILLATAAVLTGRDRDKMRAVPNVGPKCEILSQMPHRIGFDHAIGVAGGRIVEVGGPAGATRQELAAAINPNTAAVWYVVLDPKPALPLADVAEVAHEHGIPVIVDAAAELPPVSNLNAFHEAGGDLVLFSGGKDIAGPNDTGILCGKAEWVAAARGQAFPNPGIGRPLKVSKEQIVGLVFALRRFVAMDEPARLARWQGMAERMRDILQGIDGVEGEVAFPTRGGRPLVIPRTRLAIDEGVVGRTIRELDDVLEGGDPAVAVFADAANGAIWLNPQHLEDGEEELVAERVGELLRRP
ncbi:MAG TPA: aminotransferase class V-fold PLP-dependent enzyme [Candidatus Latescibacteria bacterium]|jgi:L-seryl-tRNA(Ser) seleniumtransferase|nr:aminotransferase class V-fold PLP-dependent enzyme [Candidatus Latescibacterota bacterium]HJP32564.1 aminotransferase class V-fold PLP-dependent enzyme [Candidatus Latescibacterota bacterium]